MSATDQVVIGLGEALWDCFSDSRRPGGAPANVAYQATQLGHHGLVVSRVGNDALGRELRAYLDERGIDTEYLQTDPDRPTGKVTVNTTHPGRPTFVIHEDVAWDYIAFDEPVEQVLAGASAVCFGTLAQRSDVSRATIHRCLAAARDALTVYDVNLRQLWYRREWVEASLHAAAVVKLNIDEVAVLASLLQTGSSEPQAFAEALQGTFGVQIVCVTRAEDGCLVFSPSEVEDVPGRDVEVVDAVGAGDAFTAALISGILRQWPLKSAASFANEVGTLMVTRPGAMPGVAEDLEELTARFESGDPA
jgi:fructokinase